MAHWPRKKTLAVGGNTDQLRGWVTVTIGDGRAIPSVLTGVCLTVTIYYEIIGLGGGMRSTECHSDNN